jgi:Asp-tRNA(Asn)/Glu-tRNA(Gln) amidotransferase C subunit
MKITPQDFNEVAELVGLRSEIDNMDAENVREISDEMFKQQPFFLTVLLGYRLDTSPEELDEIMKIFFLIWEYFKRNENIQTKKITEADFEKIQSRYIQMLQYVSDEPEWNDKLKIYSNDLENLKSKALLTAIFFRYNNRPVLSKMDNKKKEIILVGLRSFIECFETIIEKSSTTA